MVIALDTPVTEDGILTTNYFQGRVLSAEDLATDQRADALRRGHLGKAVGAGVVEGLGVMVDASAASPMLVIEPGLAIAADGHTLELASRVSLALTETAGEGGAVAAAGLFGPCSTGGIAVDLSGDGAYVLTMSPAAAFRDRAPRSGLGELGIAPGCGARYSELGVKFGLAAMPLAGRDEIATAFNAIASLDDPGSSANPAETLATVSRFRNLLAHLCLRSASAAGQAAALQAGTPPVFDAPASILAEMQGGDEPAIAACAVPLAVFYIDLFGVRFVDLWAVRRIARPRIAPAILSLLPDHGLERALQFEAHLGDVLNAAQSAQALRVQTHFRYLPPVGWFPASGTGTSGFSASGFFQDVTLGAVNELRGGTLADMLATSFRYDPLDLEASPCIQMFEVDQNAAALAAGAASRRIIVFADRAMNAPLHADGVAIALERLWEVYTALSRRILDYGTPARDATREAVAHAAEDAAGVANRYAAVALSGRLGTAAALAVFERLAGLQRVVADRLGEVAIDTFFQPLSTSRFTAVSPLLLFFSTLGYYANGLRNRIQTQIPETGAPGLLAAVTAHRVCAAAEAQQAINAFIGQLAGLGGATGSSDLAWVRSPDGQVHVPGAAGLRHVYRLSNDTDRQLEYQLEAAASAPTGTWSGAAEIRDSAGAAITSLTLAPGAQREFGVFVAAPGDAAVGETIALDVTGLVGPPDNLRVEAGRISLSVGQSPGNAVDRNVRFLNVSPNQTNRTVPPGGTATYTGFVVYEDANATGPVPFEFRVRLAAGTEGWAVRIEGGPAPETTPRTFARPVTLVAGQVRPVRIDIQAPAVPGASNAMQLGIVSTGSGTAINSSANQTFALSVQFG